MGLQLPIIDRNVFPLLAIANLFCAVWEERVSNLVRDRIPHTPTRPAGVVFDGELSVRLRHDTSVNEVVARNYLNAQRPLPG